jgi:hypothetical protein
MKMHACTHTTLQLSTIPQVQKAAPVVPQITAHIWHANYVIDRTQRFIVFRIGCMWPHKYSYSYRYSYSYSL